MALTNPKKQKHIVFDVIGTLTSYSKFFEALEERLGDKVCVFSFVKWEIYG